MLQSIAPCPSQISHPRKEPILGLRLVGRPKPHFSVSDPYFGLLYQAGASILGGSSPPSVLIGRWNFSLQSTVGEQNTKVLECSRGRGPKKSFADRRQHPCRSKAGALGRATFASIGIRHCRCDHDCREDHGADRQQMADTEHGIELTVRKTAAVRQENKDSSHDERHRRCDPMGRWRSCGQLMNGFLRASHIERAIRI